MLARLVTNIDGASADRDEAVTRRPGTCIEGSLALAPVTQPTEPGLDPQGGHGWRVREPTASVSPPLAGDEPGPPPMAQSVPRPPVTPPAAPPWPPAYPLWSPAPPRPPSSWKVQLVIVGAVVAGLVVLVLLLAGRTTPGTNREWSRSGDQIVSDAHASLLAASSVQLTGTMNNGRETDVYDVTVGSHSSVGTVVANGARLDVRVIGSTVYMHGREFFTTFGGPAAGAAVGDH